MDFTYVARFFRLVGHCIIHFYDLFNIKSMEKLNICKRRILAENIKKSITLESMRSTLYFRSQFVDMNKSAYLWRIIW